MVDVGVRIDHGHDRLVADVLADHGQALAGALHPGRAVDDHQAVVSLDDGARLDPVLAYWPAEAIRAPLLVDGAPVRCRDVAQDDARALEGEPGEVDGDAATVVPEGFFTVKFDMTDEAKTAPGQAPADGFR